MRHLFYWVLDEHYQGVCTLKRIEVDDIRDALKKMKADVLRGRIYERSDIIITSGNYQHDLRRLLENYEIEWERV